MLKQAAGQVLVVGFGGTQPPKELCAQATAGRLGGFILFRRNIVDVPALSDLNRQLLAAFPAEAPALLCVDQEGGRVWRVPEPVVRVPSMRELAGHHDLELTQRTAFELSTQLRTLGFNLNMAPVLDVDTNPDNPIIGDRSFGSTPEVVIAHGRAMLQGMAQAGLAACGKHFPGHGDTEVDSHLGLPRVRHPQQRIEAVELSPFAALAKELPSIMTAHIVFDALDPQRPATLSPAIATQLLRHTLGFEGVLISDDLEMRAISDHYGIEDAACQAIAAGCDALLICSKPELAAQAYEALVHHAEANSDFATRLQEAAARTLALRRRYPPQVTATAASIMSR